MSTLAPQAVMLRNLQFHYPGNATTCVLDIPFWSIPQGDRLFIQGPSGSGKSTLLNLIAGILIATQGNIEVLGQDLAQLSPSQRDRFRAQHIGVVFQQFNLIHYLSVLDNVRLAAYFGKINASEVEAKAHQLFAALRLNQSLFHQQAGQLSVGQQQRVAIARALINQPEILIADEPTSALDQDTRDRFIETLITLSAEQKTTLIFVSHDRTLANSFQHQVNLAEINRAGATSHVF